MTEQTVVKDIHAPEGEQSVVIDKPAGRSMLPILKVLTDEDKAGEREALKALTDATKTEQASEDAVSAAVQSQDRDLIDYSTMEMEAAVDHALLVARSLQGRVKASPTDSIKRRNILAILARASA
jgi:hypothetical protein